MNNTKNSHIPARILKAINHVREYHPEIKIVVFNADSHWQYMSKDFICPIISEKVDISILEDALFDNVILPSVFQLDD